VALSHYNLGLILQDSNHLREADEELRKAVGYWDPLARNQRGFRTFQRNLAHAYSVLGTAHMSDRPAEAEAWLKKALSLFEQLARRDPGRYRNDLALGQHNLAQLYQSLGRLNEAEQFLTQAVATREQEVGANPDNPYYQAQLAGDLQVLGLVYAMTKRPDKAGATYERAIGISETLHRKYPQESNYALLLGTTQGTYSQLLKDSKRLSEALAHAKQAVDLLAALVKGNPQNKYLKSVLAEAYRLRAQIHIELGHVLEASADLLRMEEQAK